MSSALTGLRVVDLTNVGPGAHCTRILADLGAEVVRIVEVEPRGSGETRQWKAPSWTYGMRRNTRPLGLDLKKKEGIEVLYRLLANADVFMIGFRPSAIERLGLHYETLRERFPRLIYCALTGYGLTGPYRDSAGHDINYQAIGGVVAMTGTVDGPPMIPGATAADSAGGGMHAVIGILSALYARQNTGRGQQVDVSATDGVVSMMSAVIDSYLATGDEPSRGRSLLTGQYPWYNVYETKDGKYLSVGAIEAKFYANVCRILGLEDLVPHQYAKPREQTEIFRRFREAFLTRTRDEWMSVFGPADTCVMPVYALREVVTDPHLLQREMVIEVEHPEHGRIRQAGIMVKLSDTPGVIRWVDPKAKEHGPGILREAGYSADEIERLRRDAVVD